MIECYQQLKQYDKARTAILYKIKISKMPNSYVELGYNYQLQKNENKATENYNLAIEQVVLNSNYAYSVAAAFEQKTLLQWAVKAYEVGKIRQPARCAPSASGGGSG